jgi:hypothetical protein
MNDSSLARFTDGRCPTAPATPGPSRAKLFGYVVALLALIVVLCAGAAWAVDLETRQAESASALPAGTFLYDDPQIATVANDALVYEENATVHYEFIVPSGRTIGQVAVRSRSSATSKNKIAINIVLDGVPQSPQAIKTSATNYQNHTWAVNLPSGNHTISVSAESLQGPDELLTDYIVLSGSEVTPCVGVQLYPGANLSAVAANHSSGTSFCVNDGTYNVSQPIEVQSADVWQGVYSDLTRPTIAGSGAQQIMNARGSTGARIQNLTVTGATGNSNCQPECGRGISGGSDLTLVNIRSTENANQGVGGAGNGLLIRDSVLDHNGSPEFYEDGTFASAAGVKSVNSLVIRNSRMTDNAWIGAWCDLECGRFEVHDSVLSGNGKAGIFDEVSTGPAIFEGNVLQNNGANALNRNPSGLLVVSSRNADAFNNTFGGNIGFGLKAVEDDRSPTLSNVTLRDNTTNGDTVGGCGLSGVSCYGNE